MINITLLKQWALPLAISTTLVGCGSDSSNSSTERSACDNCATIEYTEHGVPHITANNYKALSYGQAYAHAQENMCTLAEQIVNVRAQRALTFGPGTDNANISDDFAMLALDIYQQAENGMEKLSQDHLDALTGYANGFNQVVLDKGGAANYPSPCRDADWVPTIDAIDLHAFHMNLAVYASGGSLSAEIASATPTPVLQTARLDAAMKLVSDKSKDLGSNGWALGKDKTESGNSMLLANPHFPWSGHLRMVENQLTIPGVLNVTGVTFVGIPAVLMGFNENIAWTHTVSQAQHFTLYHLTLDPDDATRYQYGADDDGNPVYRDMIAKEHTIQVLNSDGSTAPKSTTLYSSHYGPILVWGFGGALTFRDANQGNHFIAQQWLAMDKASNLAELEQAHANYQSLPWVNTIATGRAGNAFIMDGSATANLHPVIDAGIKDVLNNPATTQLAELMHFAWREGDGQLLLNGSDPMFEWIDTGTTPIKGQAPFENAPSLLRSDYVFNANDSHWLGNVENKLEGYSIVYGPEATVRSPRTRMNARMLTEVSADGVSGLDGKFSFDELKGVVTGERAIISELLKDQLVAHCSGVTEAALNLVEACTVLAAWDGLFKNNSVGAHIFREFLNQFKTGGVRVLSQDLFAVPFNSADPVNTPSGLKISQQGTSNDPILLALAEAVKTLVAKGIDLHSTLGSLQFHMKNDERISIPGGGSEEGVFNLNLAHGLSNQGYEVFHGASWVMALEFTEEGPKADAFLAYSQSHDPESEFYADQTRLYSNGEWRAVRFSKDDIKANLVKSISLQTH